MRTAIAIVCFFLAVSAMNAESSHAFLDGFTITIGNGYDFSTDKDETTVTVALPGRQQITGRIFYSKAQDEQIGDRNAYMKLLARNLYATKIRGAFVAGKKVEITIVPVPGERDFKAYWIVLRTTDKREYAALAIDLSPSPGMAQVLIMVAATDGAAAQKTALGLLLENLKIEFSDVAG